MKHRIALVVLLVLTGAGLARYTTAAPAGQQVVTPTQFAALERKVAALQAHLKRLDAKITGCLSKPVGVTVYGDPPQEGYLYRAGDGNYSAQTAISLARGVPQAYLLASKCASAK